MPSKKKYDDPEDDIIEMDLDEHDSFYDPIYCSNCGDEILDNNFMNCPICKKVLCDICECETCKEVNE